MTNTYFTIIHIVSLVLVVLVSAIGAGKYYANMKDRQQQLHAADKRRVENARKKGKTGDDLKLRYSPDYSPLGACVLGVSLAFYGLVNWVMAVIVVPSAPNLVALIVTGVFLALLYIVVIMADIYQSRSAAGLAIPLVVFLLTSVGRIVKPNLGGLLIVAGTGIVLCLLFFLTNLAVHWGDNRRERHSSPVKRKSRSFYDGLNALANDDESADASAEPATNTEEG